MKLLIQNAKINRFLIGRLLFVVGWLMFLSSFLLPFNIYNKGNWSGKTHLGFIHIFFAFLSSLLIFDSDLWTNQFEIVLPRLIATGIGLSCLLMLFSPIIYWFSRKYFPFGNWLIIIATIYTSITAFHGFQHIGNFLYGFYVWYFSFIVVAIGIIFSFSANLSNKRFK